MKEKKANLVFNTNTLELFDNMMKIQKEHDLYRINSIILLRGLLEEKDSILYDALCATSTTVSYKQIIADCNLELEKKKKEQKELSKDENFFKIAKIDNEGSTKTVPVYLEDEVWKILNEAAQNVAENLIKTGESTENIPLDSEDLFIQILIDMPKDILNILKNNGVSIEGIKEYYEILCDVYEEAEYQEGTGEENEIPRAIADFVTIISSKYKGSKKCEILGREKECQRVIRILQKRGKKNVILLGEPGVGKTSIAERIAFDIATGNCPESLKNNIMVSLNVNSSIAGTKYRGMAEERFKILVNFLENNENVILFIDEIHTVIGAGSIGNNNEEDMANALKPFLASSKAKVIGTTTIKEYQKYVAKDEAFKRRFEAVTVKEPKSTEVYDMLKNSIKAHEKFHGVKISKSMVEYAILISSCFSQHTKNPDRTNDLIDTAMVIAKEKGKKPVDKECILENFEIMFEKFEMMDENSKKSTAYHEAGHYIVGRKSGRLIDEKGIAISIMPAEDYLGITVYDDLSDEVTIYPDRAYFIDKIAESIAGRVAEEQYTKNISSGACEDLQRANKIAYKVITSYGMSSSAENRIYLEDEECHLMSEKIRNQIDGEVKKIVSEATERAKQIISENKELLLKLVDELMKKEILDKNELEKICQRVETKHQKN